MTHYFVTVQGEVVSRVMLRKGIAKRVLRRVLRKEPLAVGVSETIYR